MQALRRWILSWLLNNSPVRIILVSLLVCYIHFSLLVTVLHEKPKPITPKNRIAVTTIEVKPQPKVVHVTQKTISTPKKQIAKPTQKQTPNSVKKKPSPTEKKSPAITKKPTQQKDKALYAKLEKQIDAVVKPIKKEPLGKITSIPKALTPKSIEPEIQEAHTGYLEEVLSLFHETLELPEVGSVIAKLELSKEGTFLSFTILSSQSAKNAVYLENHLPQLSYPPFNGSLTNMERESFEITFRNAQ